VRRPCTGRCDEHPRDAGKRRRGEESGEGRRDEGDGPEAGIDLDEAQRFAYGVLRLTPWQFWTLTLREYNLARQGHYKAVDEQSREHAHWVAPILCALTGEQITSADLLGEGELARDEQAAAAAKRLEQLEERMEKAGLKSRKSGAK
jgi:hypothetical protein